MILSLLSQSPASPPAPATHCGKSGRNRKSPAGAPASACERVAARAATDVHVRHYIRDRARYLTEAAISATRRQSVIVTAKARLGRVAAFEALGLREGGSAWRERARNCGADAILVGEALMRSKQTEALIEDYAGVVSNKGVGFS